MRLDYSSYPCIEEATILSLRALEHPHEDGAFVDGLIRTFFHDAPISCTKLLIASREKDIKKLEHFSHKLKGLSRNLGARRLCEVCQRIEDAASDGELPSNFLVRLAQDELNEALKALRGYMRHAA